MMGTEDTSQKANRPCWECRKRRYACDRGQPSCKKCQQSNKNCPGYNDQKPLQWLAPGRVSLRPVCKNRPTKVYSRTVSHVSSDEKAPDMAICIQRLNVAPEQDYATRTKDVDHATSNRTTPELPTETVDQYVPDHCRQARALRAPLYSHLSNDNLELLDAWRYYNERIIPNVKDAELVPNPSIVAVPLELLSSISPTIHHALTCASLNHFVLSSPDEIDQTFITDVRAKVFRHRGAAIKALSDEVSNAKPMDSASTISSIFSFMAMELQDSAPVHWRLHANSLQRLIDVHGGAVKLVGKSHSLATSISVYMIIVMLSNTVSPAGNQAEDCGPPDQQLRDTKALYSHIFPHILCPMALFEHTMRINQLRKRAAASPILDDTHVEEAQEILDDITAFEPRSWAEEPHFEEWLLVGNMYKAATAVYCIASLQFLNILSHSIRMEILRNDFGKNLRETLKKAMKCPKIIQHTLWPMIVAGFEATHRSQKNRDWISKSLVAISRSQGGSSPLKVRAVLARFWARGLSGWDECFDRPFNFVV